MNRESESRTPKDLNAVGEMDHAGGRFRRVSIVGKTRFTGDLRALSFNCMGESRFDCGFQSQKANIMGQVLFNASVDAGELAVMGQVEAFQGLRARTIKCMGQVQVQGVLNADEISLFGQLRVQGDCNVDKFRSNGNFRIGGLLSVDHLQVTPSGTCIAEDIGGARIEIRRRHWLWGLGRALTLFTKADRHMLEVGVVEGDEIHLEDTTAKTVRGARVVVGEGCRVDRVEYSQSISVHASSHVGEIVKT